MLTMKKYLSLLIIPFLFSACNQHEKIYDEVMEIHDEAMAKMDQIMELKTQLNEQVETLQADTLSDQSLKIDKMNSLVQNLEEADEAMMSWMREFHNDYEEVAKSEIMDYLEEQKERITDVGKQMNEAIAEAEAYLKTPV